MLGSRPRECWHPRDWVPFVECSALPTGLASLAGMRKTWRSSATSSRYRWSSRATASRLMRLPHTGREPRPTVSWSHVADGRIIRSGPGSTPVFDPRPLLAAKPA